LGICVHLFLFDLIKENIMAQHHENVATVPSIPHEHDSGGTKLIIRVTVILSVLTIVELALGFWMMGVEGGFLRAAIKGTIIILMLAKAFYIVGYFMHLKHELMNLIMTIIVPLGLFVWFIIAFLADGYSYNNNRNTYNSYYKESSTRKAPEEGHQKKVPSAEEAPAPTQSNPINR
jgi:cytochrome c oxidase subunit IV